MSWFRSEFACLLLYAPPAFLGALVSTSAQWLDGLKFYNLSLTFHAYQSVQLFMACYVRPSDAPYLAHSSTLATLFFHANMMLLATELGLRSGCINMFQVVSSLLAFGADQISRQLRGKRSDGDVGLVRYLAVVDEAAEEKQGTPN